MRMTHASVEYAGLSDVEVDLAIFCLNRMPEPSGSVFAEDNTFRFFTRTAVKLALENALAKNFLNDAGQQVALTALEKVKEP